MAETISYRFVMRRALAATWVSLNDVLLEGEYGYEKDTGKVKIGDGVTPWNDLDYFAGSGGAGLVVSDTAPTEDLVNGLEWLDPSDGTRYTYYDDGDSQQWVEFGPETQKYLLPSLAQGTSFPLSPSDGQRFYRTDLRMECFYDSTAGEWLSSQEFSFAGWTQSTGVSGSTTLFTPVRQDYAIYLTRSACETFVNGTNTGSAYWNLEISYRTPANSDVPITSFNTSSDAGLVWANHDQDVSEAVSGAAALRFAVTKTGSPGNLIPALILYYRLIVT